MNLMSIYKEMDRHIAMFERYQPMIAYMTRIPRDIEKFRRDNELIANLYCDKVCKYLAQRGWYVGSSLTGRNIVKLARAIDDGRLDAEIESTIADHVRSHVIRIEESAIKHWPDRSPILSDAFSAHRSGQFTLSIPAMLAQADGMAFDVLNAHVFTDHAGSKKSKIADRTNEFIASDLADQELMSSFVGILLVEEPGMRTPTSKRDQRQQSGRPFSPLNRHGVMHGIDSDYATESNGLRAVSLIALLTEINDCKSGSNVAQSS